MIKICRHCRQPVQSSQWLQHLQAHKNQNRPGHSEKYGAAHRALRKKWAPVVATGVVACRRCGELISPDEKWEMGHDDLDPTIEARPEHEWCNRQSSTHRIERERDG